MSSEQTVRCAKCYLRMEPHELRTVYHETTYHQHCFSVLVREADDEDNVVRAEAGVVKAARSTPV